MLALMFVVFVVLLVLGLDLWYAMGMASMLYLVGLAFFGAIPIPLTLIPQQLMAGVDSFPLLAVPMFILAGELMTRGGVTLRLVRFSSVLVGHVKGGLAQVSVVANVIMAGMSGSAAADLAATGSLLIPGMVKRGYPADFASAVIASASTIGPIIPPSLPMVIIGSMVSVSVGQLFMGGVVPGFIMGLAMMIVVYRYAHRAKLPVEPRATRSEFFHALWDGALALAMPAIVLGSIVTGIATPTEAAVVAVVYAFILGMFVYREIKWRELPELFTGVAVTSAAVMVTVAAAQLFGWITAAEGLGNAIGLWLTSLTKNPYVILLVINVVLLVLGMFMEPIPIMLLTVPILFPVITKLGIDPVHFGVVVTLNLMIGCLTPPVGLNLFLASAISGVPVMRVARASVPFIVVLLVVLALITYIPQLVLWLPHLTQAGT
jgi:C4-dicarboxylate transporter DctM subunit